MNVKNDLISRLEVAFPNYPVFLQGTLNSSAAYPDSFITVWTSFTEDNGAYDNDIFSVEWNFNVIFYTNNPVLIGTVPDTIRTTLKAAGFNPQGKGNDIPSDVDTHTGWVVEFKYKEII